MSQKKKQNRETRARVEREQMFRKTSAGPSLLTLLISKFSRRKEKSDGSKHGAG